MTTHSYPERKHRTLFRCRLDTPFTHVQKICAARYSTVGSDGRYEVGSGPYHRTNAPLMPKCLNTGMKKVCSNCTQEKPVTQFYRNIQKGKVYWSQQCKTCRPDRQRRSIASREKQRDHERTARKDPAKRANFILSACKNFDKRHGFVCDLMKVSSTSWRRRADHRG